MRYKLRNIISAVKLENSFQLNPYFYIQLISIFWEIFIKQTGHVGVSVDNYKQIHVKINN